MSDMTLSYVNTGNYTHSDAVQDTVREINDYLYRAKYIDSNYFHQGYHNPGGWNDEKSYAKAVIDDIHDGNLLDKQIIVIPHKKADWGYGRCFQFWPDGKEVNAAVVYAGSFIQKEEARLMTWHEVGHAFGNADHEHAAASFNGDQLQAVTPMAGSYAHGGGWLKEAYTTWAGGETAPDEFNAKFGGGTTDNFQGNATGGSYDEVFVRWYSDQVWQKADNWVDN